MSTDLISADPGSTESAIRDLFKKARLLVEQDNKSELILNAFNINIHCI